MRTTKPIFLSTLFALFIIACDQRQVPSPTEETRLEADDTETDRLLPKLLRGLPVGLVGAHDPNPVNAVFEDSMYVWKHNTTIRSVVGDVKLIEFGSFVWTDAGWYHRLADTPGQFALHYTCPNAEIKAGVVYTDPASWRRQETLTGGDALWYYIVEDGQGKRWKGTALVETEAVLESSLSDTGNYQLIGDRSMIQWTGYGEVGDYSLTGQLRVRSGHIRFGANTISTADVVVDMRSLEHENANLLEHLKGADFFDVQRYTDARFTATGSTPIVNDTCTVLGSLTIRGTTNPVRFPARILRQGERCTVSGTLDLDRTRFGIRFGSNSFFDDLGDQAISNQIRLEVELVGE